MLDSSFIYISRTGYSKGWKQIATAVKDASNCGYQECDRVSVMSRWQSPLLNPWRKTIRLSDPVASYKSQIASVPTTVVVSLKQGHFMSGTKCIDIILFLKWTCIPQLEFFILLVTCDFRLGTCFCYCFNQMMHEYIDTRNYPYK
ncbi:hypothetical protein H6G97_42505 [Nostoc flagelliforme FACHB-838]|uniref:Uncharacterized protein n=1 Tax=Nostoc flagelliforme FACHB-838 TaxID=2692904 RepID=A0ABR8E338_9NOSO|nr:hypothetical protein [Nostoc flagelliforme FACHB-838]